MVDENKDGIDDTVEQVSYNAVKDRIADFDFDRAVALMSAAEKIATVAPKCTSILGLAQAELEAMNTEAKEIALARKDAADKELARRREAEQNRKDEEAEKTKDNAEANRRARQDAEDDAGLQRQTGGTPNSPERVDTTPGMPQPQLDRAGNVIRPGQPAPPQRRV